LSGLHANAVSQWRECPGTRHHQVGEPTRALEDHGVGVELAPVSTGECPEWLVSRALWWRRQTPEAYRHGRGSPEVTPGAVALPRNRGHTRGCRTQSGVSGLSVLRQAVALVLVEAARYCSGPCQEAVVEMGSPPTGRPAVVERRREHWVTGVGTRTERRALETRGPNATGSRQRDRGQVTQRLKSMEWREKT
jgi:hypothetical protein